MRLFKRRSRDYLSPARAFATKVSQDAEACGGVHVAVNMEQM